MEITSFEADEEVVCMYKGIRQPKQIIPLSTVAPKRNINDENGDLSNKLEDIFQALFGEVHDLEFTTLPVAEDSKVNSDESTHLEYLKHFLRSQFAKVFAFTRATHFRCFLNCAQVTIGGFGGEWHHDATSQLTHKDGTVFEYLALYYLPEKKSTSMSTNQFPWLECALQTQEEDCNHLLDTFCPISTVGGPLLILRNSCMMHRTPVLCNLVPGSIRRFFYVPFQALDETKDPVFLSLPPFACWTPYRPSETWIKRYIESELRSHGVTMERNDYILRGKAILSLPWSEEQLSHRPNWLFEDPDDY